MNPEIHFQILSQYCQDNLFSYNHRPAILHFTCFLFHSIRINSMSLTRYDGSQFNTIDPINDKTEVFFVIFAVIDYNFSVHKMPLNTK